MPYRALPILILVSALSACSAASEVIESGPDRDVGVTGDATSRPDTAADAGSGEEDPNADDAGPDSGPVDVVSDVPQDSGADALADAAVDVASDVGGDTVSDAATDTGSDSGTDTVEDTDPGCPLGAPCNPIVIGSVPYTDSRDTARAPSDEWDFYACAPSTRETGGEWVYEITLDEPGYLTATLNDVPGDFTDVDIHILTDLDPDSCVARDNISVSVRAEVGTYYIVADTWSNSDGDEFPGQYQLDVSVMDLPSGSCTVRTEDIQMFWTSCDPGLDCYARENPDTGRTEYFLRTPATGPVVKEAHLVTVEDEFASWPTSFTDGIDDHYALSEAATGYVMDRREPWAPAGEGGSQFGQGSTGSPIPVVAEAWYVNMYWRNRPDRGTRMIITNPANGRSVVAAGGYETGPGSNARIGGASEEIHHYLGTTHLDTLTFGFAVDQTLPFGPIACE